MNDGVASADVGHNYVGTVAWRTRYVVQIGSGCYAHRSAAPLLDGEAFTLQCRYVGLVLQLLAVEGACWDHMVGQHLRRKGMGHHRVMVEVGPLDYAVLCAIRTIKKASSWPLMSTGMCES